MVNVRSAMVKRKHAIQTISGKLALTSKGREKLYDRLGQSDRKLEDGSRAMLKNLVIWIFWLNSMKLLLTITWI